MGPSPLPFFINTMMIEWNELAFSADKKCVIVDTSISSLSYYKKVTIKQIKVDVNNYIDCGPTEQAITIYDVDQYKDYDIIQDPKHKHVRLELPTKILLRNQETNKCQTSIKSNPLFFVWVIADIGEVGEEYFMAPCKCSKETSVCTLADLSPIYKALMAGIKELGNSCEIPANFINNFLQLQALEAATKTGNYQALLKYWEKFVFSGETSISTKKSCGCHGRF